MLSLSHSPVLLGFTSHRTMKALVWILLYSRLASFVDAVKASGRRRAVAGGDTTTVFPYFTLLSDTATGAVS